MLLDAYKKGLIKDGTTIVEATTGNTGLGIAFAVLNYNVKVIFVFPENSQRKTGSNESTWRHHRKYNS